VKTGQKIILPILVILFASFAVVTVASSTYASSSSKELINNQMQDTVNLVKTPIDLNTTVVATMTVEIEKKNLSLCKSFSELIASIDENLFLGGTADNITWMQEQAQLLSVDELYITDAQGIVIATNNIATMGYDFKSSPQSNVFLEGVNNPDFELIQESQPRGADGLLFQYIGVGRKDKPGIVQVGVSVSTINTLLDELSIDLFINDFTIGKSGGVIMFDSYGNVTGHSGEKTDLVYSSYKLYSKVRDITDEKKFIHYEDLYLLVANYAGYKIIIYLPYSELTALYIPQVLISVVVGILCIIISGFSIYWLVKHTLLNPAIELANEAKNLKAGMNLDEKKYDTNSEFKILSNSLNSMINTLDISQQTIQRLNLMEKDLKEKLSLEELITSISKKFITIDNIENKIKEAVGETSNFLKVSRMILSSVNNTNSEGIINFLWFADDKYRPKEKSDKTGGFIKKHFNTKFNSKHGVSILYCNDVSQDKDFDLFLELGVKSICMTPLYVNKVLWGVMSIEDCENARVWEESEKQFLMLLTSVFTSALQRDSVEKQKNEALRQAEQASAAKSDFLAKMSHEMRTPLNAIIGMTSIARDTDVTAKKDECITKIDYASKHLLGVINDILDMSKIEANKMSLFPVEFDFKEMLNRIDTIISVRIREKHQNFIVDIDENIPSLLFGDDQRLTQVIVNLLGNATKFTPEKGKIQLKAKLAKTNGDDVVIKFNIIDSGIGISKEQQEKLFHAFEQAENSTSRTYGGTGLGLVISKRIIELFDGNIKLESELNKGSNFEFTIALKKIEIKESVETEEVNTDFTGKRILLVEDVEINREIVMTLLSTTNMIIDPVENGLLAVETIRKNPELYDLIFMDLQMPVMDGFEATRNIRLIPGKPKTIPILAMTANVFKEDIEKCLAVGMNNHISKPIDIMIILKMLNKYLK
jgi:signal transduction histidine kinase